MDNIWRRFWRRRTDKARDMWFAEQRKLAQKCFSKDIFRQIDYHVYKMMVSGHRKMPIFRFKRLDDWLDFRNYYLKYFGWLPPGIEGQHELIYNNVKFTYGPSVYRTRSHTMSIKEVIERYGRKSCG